MLEEFFNSKNKTKNKRKTNIRIKQKSDFLLTFAKSESTILPVTAQLEVLIFPKPSSGTSRGLTKLKPRKSSCAVALGGISGESLNGRYENEFQRLISIIL